MPPTREILPLLAKQRIPTDVSIVAVTSTFEKQDRVREDAMSSGFPQESESANSSVGTLPGQGLVALTSAGASFPIISEDPKLKPLE